MNLAITILVAVAIAAVIGTVLKQNQPYQDYLIEFGPFWHQVFRDLGLYDVYSTAWFMLLLAFLVTSTSVCVYRNGPTMLRDMRRFRENAQEKSLRSMHNMREWRVAKPAAEVQDIFVRFTQAQRYRVRTKDHGDHQVVAAMKGGFNRLGYLFTHIGLVVICIGALVDGNAALKLKALLGEVKIETQNLPVSQVPASSVLKPGQMMSFRGSVTIPEGSTANIVFLNVRDGYLVQQLPFGVELKQFRIEHYPSGQPKNFESDLVIHDPRLKQPLHATIQVNHPLIYRGYAIYQASFGDGGSTLDLRAWPLHTPNLKPLDLKGVVNTDEKVNTPAGERTLEFSNFKIYNVFPAPPSSGKKFENFGPSFTFKLRDPSGEAKEYVNYMSPVLQDGRLFFLSGMRATPADEFRYVHIPADSNASVDRFLHFEAMLNDDAEVRKVAQDHAARTLASAKMNDPKVLRDVTESMVRLVHLFARGGFQAVLDHIDANVPKDRRPQVTDAYSKVLQSILQALYVELLHQEGVDTSKGVSQSDSQFYDDAINAMNDLSRYGSPFYLQLVNFKQVQASGLQIAKAPGKNIVYLGCIMLISGIFLMFYVSHRRLWAMIRPEGDATQVVFAGSGSRHQREFSRDFAAMAERIDKHLNS